MVSMCVGLLEEVPLPGSLQSLVLVVASLVCFQLPLQPPARSHCGRCCLRLFFVLNFHWTLDESCMPSRKRNDGEAHSHNNISVFEIAVKVGQSADFGIHHQWFDLASVVLARRFPLAPELATRTALF